MNTTELGNLEVYTLYSTSEMFKNPENLIRVVEHYANIGDPISRLEFFLTLLNLMVTFLSMKRHRVIFSTDIIALSVVITSLEPLLIPH